MIATSASNDLSCIVDDHFTWFILWHRLAFLDSSARQEQVLQLIAPDSLIRWQQTASTYVPRDQPMIDQLAQNYHQLHKLARLILLKTPDGQAVNEMDYVSLTTKFNELMCGLRQMERAFTIAASGLDVLTGLRSRVGMQEELLREHNRFLHGGKPFCIAIMDIDHFKTINDTYGHDAGDQILAAVANHISRSLRLADDAYRFGGEEFLLCLKDTDSAGSVTILERLRANLEKTDFTLADGRIIKLTASFGLCVSKPDQTIEELTLQADQALYQAKKEGRNRVCVGES